MSSFVKEPAGTDESRDIVVRGVSAYIAQESDLSDPSDRKYVFAYHIDIENRGMRAYFRRISPGKETAVEAQSPFPDFLLGFNHNLALIS